jgi:hypothetical protein
MGVSPTVFYDYEFGFRTRPCETVTAQEGRDVIDREDGARVHLVLRPEPNVTEDITVWLADLAYLRVVRREVVQERTFEDALSEAQEPAAVPV